MIITHAIYGAIELILPFWIPSQPLTDKYYYEGSREELSLFHSILESKILR